MKKYRAMRIKCIPIILVFLFTHQLYASSIMTEFIKITLMIQVDNFISDAHLQEEGVGVYDSNQLLLRTLNPKKRRALELFKTFAVVTAAQIRELFGCKPRTSEQLCQNWVKEGFLVVINPSNKNRSYGLAPKFEVLITS
jgi:hypothetical protein